MREPKLSASGLYLSFDDMCWPTAGDANAELEWVLRYGTPTKEQLLCAASVLAAYRQMVSDTVEKRQKIVRILREHS